MPMYTGLVTISQEEYNELLDIKARYEALQCGGVDNWEGYSWSLQEYYDDPNDEDKEE